MTVVAFRLMIRPTDNAVDDEFWVAIAGSDIDWQKLSSSPEHFVNGVKKLSGLDSLEVTETMSLNYYRYVSPNYTTTRRAELWSYRINIRMADSFRKGRVFIAGGV